MNSFFYLLLAPASPLFVDLTLLFMRIGIGVIMTCHGFPKIFGGPATWSQLGTLINPLGIYFWPTMWGFFAACAQFFGGIMFILGFGTRLAAASLLFSMIVAATWHISRKEGFNNYAYALTLIVIFGSFLIIGGGPLSLDYYLIQ